MNICKKLRILAGYPMFELVSIAAYMKRIDDIPDFVIPEDESNIVKYK